MEEQRESSWESYSPPSPTWGERAARAFNRHGFPVLLGLTILISIGGILWFVPQDGPPALNATGENLQPESPDERSQGNPYTGKAEFSVRSQPSGALVVMDEDTLGVTPQEQRTVDAGAHFVSVQKEGYARVDSVLILRNDRPATLRARLIRSTDSSGPLPRADDDASPAARGEWQAEAPNAQTPSQPSIQPESPPTSSQASSQESPQETQPDAQQSDAQQSEETADGGARRYGEALRQGDELFVEERYEEALASYTEALDVRPGDEHAEERLQKTRQRLGEEKHRAQQYQYHRARGDVLFEQGRYREATSDYEQALAHRPEDEYASERLRESRTKAEESDRLAERTPAELPTQEPEEEARPVRMNLNMATAEQLQQLPGIGPKTMAELKPLLFVEAP